MDKDRDGVVSGNDLRLAMKEMNVGVPRAVVPLLLQKCGADPDVGMDFAAYAETQREHAKIVPSPDFAREPLWTPDEYFRNKWAKAPQPALTPPRTPAVLEPGFRQMPGWPLMSEFTPAQHAPLSSRKSDAERARLRASVEERFRERVPIELERAPPPPPLPPRQPHLRRPESPEAVLFLPEPPRLRVPWPHARRGARRP
jgi:hypothetical protein